MDSNHSFSICHWIRATWMFLLLYLLLKLESPWCIGSESIYFCTYHKYLTYFQMIWQNFILNICKYNMQISYYIWRTIWWVLHTSVWNIGIDLIVLFVGSPICRMTQEPPPILHMNCSMQQFWYEFVILFHKLISSFCFKDDISKYEGCSLISAIGFVSRKSALPPESKH